MLENGKKTQLKSGDLLVLEKSSGRIQVLRQTAFPDERLFWDDGVNPDNKSPFVVEEEDFYSIARMLANVVGLGLREYEPDNRHAYVGFKLV
ncbi:MAG: hypothetical protein A3J09_01290 [Candidatus Zambryskibacteria bacterium RIFCSPLOWO2_02_FULL_51_21]|uniref:Uncharacterized protein n=1 Tax=Candidatus Zambryskibacteria bacterium RIFCSPHIGHO2_02_FULL_43_37 TaxID=1802749 RepID=A0A1G2TIW4_9BACT|nr:MAG: hypothetical protein A2723_01290 [Candidatus Zambryskibacteria bacterium RIFCSPHIGHO2_01_FULL_52_18]OHA96551.1 MAG: hypothetical protein A3D49_01610 [Candidatus Zambryskibacteria bacterium RIFCSPHIGHO2_02_FULL_43_37]OHB07536.1 MAG: hypothetical protein A2944_01450 [Candidatus Zambryskibacteria bacterium RIFCSPLOWO2_01_FULL_52_12]OHB11185.1 MAG: hypothetical protein A3J09_01290 [Candidatus Zambryskibacteria bacterium RIFCSPLOWO2_02_FULL_51_21]